MRPIRPCSCRYCEALLNMKSLGNIRYMRCCRQCHRYTEEMAWWCSFFRTRAATSGSYVHMSDVSAALANQSVGAANPEATPVEKVGRVLGVPINSLIHVLCQRHFRPSFWGKHFMMPTSSMLLSCRAFFEQRFTTSSTVIGPSLLPTIAANMQAEYPNHCIWQDAAIFHLAPSFYGKFANRATPPLKIQAIKRWHKEKDLSYAFSTIPVHRKAPDLAAALKYWQKHPTKLVSLVFTCWGIGHDLINKSINAKPRHTRRNSYRAKWSSSGNYRKSGQEK